MGICLSPALAEEITEGTPQRLGKFLTLAPCLRRSGAHCRKTSDSSWPRHNLNRRSSGMGWSLLGRRIRVIVSAFGCWRDIANSLVKKRGRAWAGVVRSVGDCLFI